MATFLQLIPRLRDASVEFVIIGGFAAILHGGCRQTSDLDIVALEGGPPPPIGMIRTPD
jgi:hypothetical protein